MALTQNQSQVSTELGATVSLLVNCLDQCKKVANDLTGLNAKLLAGDCTEAAELINEALSLISKDLQVVNDLGQVS